MYKDTLVILREKVAMTTNRTTSVTEHAWHGSQLP
jgi:hypothetical protein